MFFRCCCKFHSFVHSTFFALDLHPNFLVSPCCESLMDDLFDDLGAAIARSSRSSSAVASVLSPSVSSGSSRRKPTAATATDPSIPSDEVAGASVVSALSIGSGHMHGDNHTGKDANGTGTGTDILTQMFGPSCGARSPTASTNGTVNNANVMTHLSGPSHGAQAAERQLANQPTLRLGPSTWLNGGTPLAGAGHGGTSGAMNFLLSLRRDARGSA